MSKTRTENVAKNVILSSLFQIIAYVIGFVSRTIFIKILGEEYLGLNGVFTNVLTLLSFAELGIGSAIVYSMYKPLATNNSDKLKELIAFYKKIYLLVGMIIIIGGIILIPFLDFFIKSTPNINENIIIIYLIFVINSAISYFFSYRTSIISADQKNYLIIIYNKVFHIIRVIVQIIIILVWHNYYLYLLTETICTLLANYLLTRKSKKMYPELIDLKNHELPKEEKKEIFNKFTNQEHLSMDLVDAQYTLDKTKILFTYIAADRVDFRNLLKLLAGSLHCRIELRQVNVRERAQIIGGIGVCGLPLCCTTFLKEFEGVSLSKAKNQMLTINIPKLSGQCGKLMCCLKFEDEAYSEEKKNFPAINTNVKYNDEVYKVTSFNIISKIIRIETKENVEYITLEDFKKLKKVS